MTPPSHIRIYCVTIPRSARHKKMREHLDSLNTPYEFVYGYPMQDAPANHLALSKLLGDTIRTGKPEFARAAINAFSCRMAMLAANEKFLDDGGEWALIIQDDVELPADWKEHCDWNISNCPVTHHSIAVCPHPKFPVKENMWNVTEKDHTYTETAMLVPREYAKANVIALKEAPSISDYCFFRRYGVSKCFRSPRPFVKYNGEYSYIQHVTPRSNG